MSRTEVHPEFLPQPFMTSLGKNGESMLPGVEIELMAEAMLRPTECYGYFPAFGDPDVYLGQSTQFGEVFDTLPGMPDWHFSFLRLSLGPQKNLASLHLDTTAETGLGGDTEHLEGRLIWRGLVNLSDVSDRQVVYYKYYPFHLALDRDQGHVRCVDGTIDRSGGLRTIVVPRRQGPVVHGITFCASQVLHCGVDEKTGHFVGGYGYQEV